MMQKRLPDTIIPIIEAQFQATVREYAEVMGWLVGFTHDSRHSETGEPDLRMVHPQQDRVLFMEIKSPRGRIRKGRWNKKQTRWLPGQDEWAEALKQCSGIEYYLFQPSDWAEIRRVLEPRNA